MPNVYWTSAVVAYVHIHIKKTTLKSASLCAHAVARSAGKASNKSALPFHKEQTQDEQCINTKKMSGKRKVRDVNKGDSLTSSSFALTFSFAFDFQ